MADKREATASELRTFGVSRAGVRDLLPGCEDAWDQLAEIAVGLAASERAAQAREDFREGKQRPGLKQFLLKYQDQQRFTPEHPLYRLGTDARLVEVASEGAGEPMELYSADLWYVMPGASDRPQWSQNWHRDPEAPNLVKVFAYVLAVDDESGPFEYVPESHCHGSKYQRRSPDSYGDTVWANDIPEGDRRRFCEPAGTLLLANTSGLHRGGRTRSRPRLNTCWTYLPRGLKQPVFEVSA